MVNSGNSDRLFLCVWGGGGASKSLASLVASTVKCLLTMQETWVRSQGWKDPLEKEMATHSRTLAWKIPWTEEPGRLQSMGSQRVRHDWATSLSLSPKSLQVVIAAMKLKDACFLEEKL